MKKICLFIGALILIMGMTACTWLDFSKPDENIPELGGKPGEVNDVQTPEEATKETRGGVITEVPSEGDTQTDDVSNTQPAAGNTEEGLRSNEDADLISFAAKASETLTQAVEPNERLLLDSSDKDSGGYYYTSVSSESEMKARLEEYFDKDLYESLMLICQVKKIDSTGLAVPKNYQPYYRIDAGGDFTVLEKTEDYARISMPFTLAAKSSGRAKNDTGECILRKNSEGYWKITGVSQWFDDYVLKMHQMGYGLDVCITKAGYQLSGPSYKGESVDYGKLAGEKRAVLSPSGKYSLKIKRIPGSKEDKLSFAILDRNGGELYESAYPLSEYFTYYAAWDPSLDAVWVYVGLPSSGSGTEMFGLSSRGLIYCSGEGGEWAETLMPDLAANKSKAPTVIKQLSTAFE